MSASGGSLPPSGHSHACDQTLPDDLTALSLARGLVSRAAAPTLPADRLEDALLATSELVTNALLHGRAPIRLTIDRSEQQLRVAVSDESATLPAAVGAPPEPSSAGGRGLLIVAGVSARWGIERGHGQHGKTVWFEV